MSIELKPGSRLERIIKKLLANEELVEKAEKGSIEINYSGKSETIQVKVMIQ